MIKKGKQLKCFIEMFTCTGSYINGHVINNTNKGIMRDVTDQEIEKAKRSENANQTMEITDKVVAKQMSVVQEIASLLEETTSEIKVALKKLKENFTYITASF